MKTRSFKSFLNENNDEPYEILILTHSQAHVRDTDSKDTGDHILLAAKAKKEGIKVHVVDFPGLEIKKGKDGGHILTSYAFDKDGLVIMPDDKGNKEYQEPINIHPEKTLILARGLGTIGFTGNRNWYDEMKNFEMHEYTLVNDTEAFDLCTSKYLTYLNHRLLQFLIHTYHLHKEIYLAYLQVILLHFPLLTYCNLNIRYNEIFLLLVNMFLYLRNNQHLN